MRNPFNPPYTARDLEQLDKLHGLIGLYDYWMKSESRKKIAKKKAIILHASTRRHKEWGGQKRYVRIIIHDNEYQLRRAANELTPDEDHHSAVGVFHPAPFKETYDKKKDKWIRTEDKHYAGVIRLCHGHLTEQTIIHECVHAACCIFRMDVHSPISLGRGCWANEETLAYIIGDLSEVVLSKVANYGKT